MYYLEKQINGGDWVAIFKDENKENLVEQINLLREKEFSAIVHKGNSFFLPAQNVRYRIVDKDFAEQIEKQLEYVLF